MAEAAAAQARFDAVAKARLVRTAERLVERVRAVETSVRNVESHQNLAGTPLVAILGLQRSILVENTEKLEALICVAERRLTKYSGSFVGTPMST